MGRLMQLNGISDPDLVETGRVLRVPGGSAGGTASRGSAPSGGMVTVQEGETLSEIAERHGMSMQRLMAINGISTPDHVEAGRRLRVSGAVTAAARPAAAPTNPAPSYRRGASEHVVRAGESLSTIADGYGVPLSRLVSINAIGDPDLVQAGTRLKLKGNPAPAAAPAAAAAPRPRPVTTASDAPRPQPKPTAVAVATPRPTANPTPATSTTPAPVATKTATARPGGTGLATTPGTGKPDWRTYGPLQVDWANWQPMGGSMVAPTLNGEGQSLYLAVNCTARKINATSQAGQWKTWDDPQADFEQQLVNDLCKARG
ncbi:MAG: LysM peptidoglycan-binding domain-containing protein [Cyanobium sp.]